MSYLPGVPNMGPAPVSPVSTGANTTVGKPGGIAAIAHGVGKPSNTQHLGSIIGLPGKGSTSVGGGDPMAHSLSQYMKTAGGAQPTAHAGVKNAIRGGKMGPHVKRGGLGQGPMGMPGPDDNVNTSQDTE